MVFLNFNMEVSLSIKRNNIVCLAFVVAFLHFVPYCRSLRLPYTELKLIISDNVEPGFIVLINDIITKECTDIHHVQKSARAVLSKPINIQDGRIVTNSSLTEFVGDLFIIQTKTSNMCNKGNLVFHSDSSIYIEVIPCRDSLHFAQDLYTGTIQERSGRGTRVEGITDLYACAAARCPTNLEYKLSDARNFYLQTISQSGHIKLSIHAKRPLSRYKSTAYKLIIIVENSDGQQGHTNVEVKIVENQNQYAVAVSPDDNLYFRSHTANSRHRRQTQTTLPDRSVKETDTGDLFSVADGTMGESFSLKSSTYENAFSVSSSGMVSVPVNFHLDYETLTNDGGPNPVELVITVSRTSDNTVLRELIQRVTIEDVNDEDPVFTNRPSEYLATVSVTAPPNSPVYSLTAIDPDASSALALTFSFGLVPPAQDFFDVTINGNVADITRKGSQAFTLNQEFSITVTATDNDASGPQPQRTEGTVKIKAGNRNPQFLQTAYTEQFQEGNFVDLKITSEPIEVVTFQRNAVSFAVFDDLSQPSTLFMTRSAQTSDDRTRACDLIVTKVMDYETDQQVFQVTVSAIEETTGLSSEVGVEIRVLDKNEFAPQFSVSVYKKENVREDINVGQYLLNVTATDMDSMSKVFFSVDNDHFRIEAVEPDRTTNPHTANIYVNKKLDYDLISPKLYDFSVRATDNGNLPKSGEATVRIFMININDESPKFPENMSADIRYDSEVGHDVYSVQTRDDDFGDGVSYQFVGSYPKFQLDGATGRITLREKIANTQEQITQFEYKLIVRATDDGACCPNQPRSSKTSTGTITVNILTTNEHRPVFQNCQGLAPQVDEEKDNEFVTRVTATDADVGENGEVRFSIKETNSRFRINATTGEIFTDERIDRETLGAFTKIPVNVLATDGGNLQSTCSLLIEIIDVNDNAPVFRQPSYQFNILMSDTEGMIAETVEATDADIGVNAQMQYSFLSNPGGYFRFDTASRFTGTFKVNQTLPQTAGSTVDLVIQAEDGGNPALRSNVTATVTFVSDPAKLPPVWLTNNLQVTVPENVTQGQQLLRFTARAQSTTSTALSFGVVGEDMKLLFRAVKDTNPANAVNQTGYLINQAPLDYDTTASTNHIYQVTIRATDGAGALKETKVSVILTDVNDHTPIFFDVNEDTNLLELDLVEGDYTGVAFPGELIGKITARDEDGSAPNNVIESYSLSENNSLFYIDPNSGNLYTQGVFDREAPRDPFYIIQAEAEDGAPSSHFPDGRHNIGSLSVKITIIDFNDNPPTFAQTNYNITANEDWPTGRVVQRITANDPDSDAILKYSIKAISPDQAKFSIVPETGDILVAGPLDYDEGETKYVTEVSVFDRKFTNTATVTIQALDVNDNPPEVPDYQFNDFYENDTSVIGVIQTVQATDKDNNGHNTFNYFLSFTDPADAQYFAINENTGEISVRKALDRDYPNGKAEFKFTVEVSDGKLFGYGEVNVRPKDINDNAPVFPPDGRNMQVQEEQDKPGGTLVGRVSVVDYDEGVNKEFDLTIVQQDPEPANMAFELRGTNNLDLYAIRTLDREKIDKYYLVMLAVDRGTPSLTGTGTLTITVTDINDNSPVFNVSVYHFILSESQKRGEIGRIKAFDADILNNAELTYSLEDTISDAYQFFQMDQDRTTNEGVLVIYQAVDFDDLDNLQRRFTLTAYAIDNNPGPNNENRAETTILLTVTDYNDEVLTFDVAEKSVEVLEDAAEGFVLETFRATDRDVDPEYSRFEYYISQKSDPTHRFMINQQGQVKILNALDREAHASHTVHILAIDNIDGEKQNTGTATLIVTVKDVNDNYPDFAGIAEVRTLMENEDFNNAELLTFSAVDADLPKNGPPFSFAMDCSTSPTECVVPTGQKFTLDVNNDGDDEKGTGTIFVTGRFDREVQKVVTLPIKMCDRRGLSDPDQQCGVRYLDIDIADRNDNKHEDGYQYVLVYNYKGEFGNFLIGTVNSNDPDDMDTDKVFTLQNEAVSGYFVLIDENNGEITLKDVVPEMSFEVTVRVRDASGLAKNSVVRIDVVYITEDAVTNSGSVRINGISPEEFLFKPKKTGAPSLFGDSMYQKFRKRLAMKLYGSSTPENLEKVQILSVMGDATHTDVRFSAHGSPWYSSSKMDGIVTSDINGFSQTLTTEGISNTGTIDMVPIDMCQFEHCEGGCYNRLVIDSVPRLVDTKGASYVGVTTNVVGTCGCRATNFSSEVACTPGYCYHGGECVQDIWNVVSCKCPAGYDGPRCQVLKQSFSGTGYGLYRQLEQCEDSRTSIEIITTRATALILYNGPIMELDPIDQTDFILLELVDGYPRLRINQGTGEIPLEITGSDKKKLNDNTWHRIDIFRNKKHVRMVVDHCKDSKMENDVEDRTSCEASGYTRGENIFINVVHNLQLGGRMSNPSYPINVHPEKFEGCMKNLIHNAEIYDLATEGQFPGVQDGCPREDNACGAAGCDHGKCEITGTAGPNVQGTCICDPGWRQATRNGVCNTNTTKRDLKTNSFMDWSLKQLFLQMLDSRVMEVSFQFRTRDTDGIMFSVTGTQSTFIRFKIVGERLQASYNLGKGVYEIPLPNVKVSDGAWHTIKLNRYGKEFMLKLDSGEGRYYAESLGPVSGGKVDFTAMQEQTYAGANVVYSSNSPVFNGEDFENSCLNDIRYDSSWFPMTNGEEALSVAANIITINNTVLDCVRDDCTPDKCLDPKVCVPKWGDFDCVCKEHYVESGATCVPIDYCADSPCFGAATCINNVPPWADQNPFSCICPSGWYGVLCQCHQSLNPEDDACTRETDEEPDDGMAGDIIAAIVIGILLLIVAVLFLVYFIFFRRTESTKEVLGDDFRDDRCENAMNYDEIGLVQDQRINHSTREISQQPNQENSDRVITEQASTSYINLLIGNNARDHQLPEQSSGPSVGMPCEYESPESHDDTLRKEFAYDNIQHAVDEVDNRNMYELLSGHASNMEEGRGYCRLQSGGNINTGSDVAPSYEALSLGSVKPEYTPL